MVTWILRAFLEPEKNYDDVHGDEANVKKLMVKRVDYAAMEFGNGMAPIKSTLL